MPRIVPERVGIVRPSLDRISRAQQAAGSARASYTTLAPSGPSTWAMTRPGASRDSRSASAPEASPSGRKYVSGPPSR